MSTFFSLISKTDIQFELMKLKSRNNVLAGRELVAVFNMFVIHSAIYLLRLRNYENKKRSDDQCFNRALLIQFLSNVISFP